MKQTLTQRVSKLEGLVNHLSKNGTIQSKCIDELTRIVEQKPYTAMRSTGGLFSGGDKKYCECDEPLTDSVYWKDKCFYCSKPIKSQEDVREKIAQLLIEIRESGESHRNWRHDVFTYVGLILAIVKGE